MRIMMVSSELWPVAKVGGLADAVAALSKTLSRLGHEITIALPRYRAIDDAGLMLARRLTPLKLSGGIDATLFDARLSPGVELLFVDLPGLYDRAGIYDERGEPYPDNLRRFGAFCQAVATFVQRRAGERDAFEAVHAHDWPAALVPYLLRRAGSAVRTVLTVHNAAHQGRFESHAAGDVGLEVDDALAFGDRINLLKAGIATADVVTTVSMTYAEEIRTREGGHGLDEELQARKSALVGITNGIDYSVWSPSTDPHLVARYDAEEARNKGRCKASVLSELELSIDPDLALLVSVGRVCHQKGSDLLADALPAICRAPCQVVVAGAGEPELERRLEAAVARCSPAAVYLGHVSEAMTHRLIAGADAVVMPSRYEPCGLVQQYAQRYGAAPVARAVGGIVDTVVDCDAELVSGTGFLFDEPTPSALEGAVARTISAMSSPHWGELRRRMMRLDRSWERPARQYLRAYQAS
jgi:starch synthase